MIIIKKDNFCKILINILFSWFLDLEINKLPYWTVFLDNRSNTREEEACYPQ